MKVRRLITPLAVMLLAAGIMTAGACGSDRSNSTGPLGSGGNGGGFDPTGGSGAQGVEACDEPGAQRECHVQLNEENCFVGVETCEDGEWSACRDGSVVQAALSTNTNCVFNPCNPTCQTFDENPPTDVTIPGTGAPPGGPIDGLPPGLAGQGINEPCAGSFDCQYDTQCVTPGNTCDPWLIGAYASTGGLPDYTVPIPCGGTFLICNRGDGVASAGAEVHVISGQTSNLSLGTCTGASPAPPLAPTCVTPADIAPGACIDIAGVPGCDTALTSGNQTIVVNSQDYAAAPQPEANCDNNWSVDHNGSGTCQCGASSAAASVTDVNMVVMFDTSGSMGPIFAAAKQGFRDYIALPSADSLNMALRFFGNNPSAGCNEFTCSVAACTDMQVGMGSLGNPLHEAALDTALAAAATGSAGTPHVAATQGAIQAAINLTPPGNQPVVVYVSDGQTTNPACESNTAPCYAAAQNGYNNNGVRFFTIGLTGVNATFMQNLANLGGGTALGVNQFINLSGLSGAALVAAIEAAFDSIQNSVVSCSLTIPNASQVDPNNITVDYFPMGMAPPRALADVGPGNCMGTDEFFVSSPTTIDLCPTVCAEIQADLAAEVVITGGCVGAFGTTIIEPFQDYQGACADPAANTNWDFLVYDTTSPPNTSIAWEARTAVTQAGLAAATWVPIDVATNADPDADWGVDPVDLQAALGFSAQGRWIEFRLIMTPSPDGTVAPALHSWDITYSCPIAE